MVCTLFSNTTKGIRYAQFFSVNVMVGVQIPKSALYQTFEYVKANCSHTFDTAFCPTCGRPKGLLTEGQKLKPERLALFPCYAYGSLEPYSEKSCYNWEWEFNHGIDLSNGDTLRRHFRKSEEQFLFGVYHMEISDIEEHYEHSKMCEHTPVIPVLPEQEKVEGFLRGLGVPFVPGSWGMYTTLEWH